MENFSSWLRPKLQTANCKDDKAHQIEDLADAAKSSFGFGPNRTG